MKAGSDFIKFYYNPTPDLGAALPELLATKMHKERQKLLSTLHGRCLKDYRDYMVRMCAAFLFIYMFVHYSMVFTKAPSYEGLKSLVLPLGKEEKIRPLKDLVCSGGLLVSGCFPRGKWRLDEGNVMWERRVTTGEKDTCKKA